MIRISLFVVVICKVIARVDRFGFVTKIKPAQCLEVDSINVFMGIATFLWNYENKSSFLL